MTIQNNETVYDEQIAPLMTQILAICKEHEMSMAASFEYAPGDYCSTFLLFGGDGELVQDLSRRIERSIQGPAPLQITTTKEDGSKIVEVILP